MMPAPPVKRAVPSASKANSMAPPGGSSTAANTNKFAKVAGGTDASGTAGSGGGGGEALPRAAGAGPLPHAHTPLISTQGGGGAGSEVSDPYDPARPNDYMAHCREVCAVVGIFILGHRALARMCLEWYGRGAVGAGHMEILCLFTVTTPNADLESMPK